MRALEGHKVVHLNSDLRANLYTDVVVQSPNMYTLHFVRALTFFLSQIYIILIKFTEKHDNIFNSKQTCYQNIFNIRFNGSNLMF
ncbi:Os09g0343400 [Oryza sativa Japonica Group]|uniref:Os09g0343400 protein n=1 Tax=Oryza sativa subsp. japonica TaxID=39947 RepID=Q0J2H3_ORYSJ|nr:Os09g0343400 [Oryza sativa Japonica Group]|eukprot:NP_001062928.1 Os09g0343400 [Oryza sativa Japonica Group]